jgi:hypothetical protein
MAVSSSLNLAKVSMKLFKEVHLNRGRVEGCFSSLAVLATSRHGHDTFGRGKHNLIAILLQDIIGMCGFGQIPIYASVGKYHGFRYHPVGVLPSSILSAELRTNRTFPEDMVI